MTRLQGEIARRRTFAIISHPDAGKTTLRLAGPPEVTWPGASAE